jgi:hypothetical protein
MLRYFYETDCIIIPCRKNKKYNFFSIVKVKLLVDEKKRKVSLPFGAHK